MTQIDKAAVGGSQDDNGDANLGEVLLVWDALVHREQCAKSGFHRLPQERSILQSAPTHLANRARVVPRQLSGELPGQMLIEKYEHRRRR
jgi:hypothetical protein